MCRPDEDLAETMSVAELIEELKKHKPDALVYMDSFHDLLPVAKATGNVIDVLNINAVVLEPLS